MQNLIKKYTAFSIASMLSLSLCAQSVFASDTINKVSYLDSVSSSYLNNQNVNGNVNNNFVADEPIEAIVQLNANQKLTDKDIRVDLSLNKADVREVLRMLADKAGLNMLLPGNIFGPVTLDVKNVDINDVFNMIFTSRKLIYYKTGNIINVMPANEQGYPRQKMTVIPVKYVNATSIATFLNENLFKSQIEGLSKKSIVTSNPATNQIIAFGTDADIAAIKRVLPVLDAKPIVNNYKVSHTTPKEMANLVCDSLFLNSGGESNSKSVDNNDLSPDEVVLGGGVVACRDISDPEIHEGSNLASLRVNPLTITYFPELGKISAVGGSPEQSRLIGDFIKEHDKKQLMAYVELSVIELNETGSKEFSNEWNLWTPFISLSFAPSTGLTVGGDANPFFLWGNNVTTKVTKKTYNSDSGQYEDSSDTEVISKSNNKALTYKLKYLIENGNGRVLTNPKIMVTNGKKATIDMTSDYVKSVTSQILQGSDTITSATQRTYDIGSDEGLKIEIVPFISPDGYVSMNISPEFATIKERVYAANDRGDQELNATLLQRRDLELKNIRIRDGETLVLAGLIKEQEQQSVQKMPILSDLPFIGAFFRGNSNNKAREELVIVVTPHIIKDNDSVNSNVYDL